MVVSLGLAMVVATTAPVMGSLLGGTCLNGIQGQFWLRDHLGVHYSVEDLWASDLGGVGVLIWKVGERGDGSNGENGAPAGRDIWNAVGTSEGRGGDRGEGGGWQDLRNRPGRGERGMDDGTGGGVERIPGRLAGKFADGVLGRTSGRRRRYWRRGLRQRGGGGGGGGGLGWGQGRREVLVCCDDRGLLVEVNGVGTRGGRRGSVCEEAGVGDEDMENVGNGGDVENGLEIAEYEGKIGRNDDAECHFHCCVGERRRRGGGR
jgi:hypothetical protein